MSTEDSKLTQHSAPIGYWGWEPSGKSISIQISLDVVDRMLSSIIDGFGSIPKRGAEVGGLLIGTAAPGTPSIYRIEEFVDVPCLHKFGPSYVFCEEDHHTLQSALAHESRNAHGFKVLGFYRSHTREGLYLAPEDLELARRYFPEQDQIALLVRPSAMGVSHAGFFYREADAFQSSTYFEFPFRRSELETGSAPVRRPLGERMRGEQGRRPMPPPAYSSPGSGAPQQPPSASQQPYQPHQPYSSSGREPLSMPTPPPYSSHRREREEPVALGGTQTQPPQHEPVQLPYNSRSGEEDIPMPSQVYAVTTPAQSRLRKGWYWLPLSFIFMLFGVALGFLAAITIYPSSRTGGAADAYSLMLSASRSGDAITVRWDRQNAAVRASKRGALEIVDGKYSKHVELDATALQSGSVIYRYSSSQVKFTLEVFPQEGVKLSEIVEWPANAIDQ